MERGRGGTGVILTTKRSQRAMLKLKKEVQR
jgi:hypothetical protein